MTFLGRATEHFSGENGSEAYCILVVKQTHNVKKAYFMTSTAQRYSVYFLDKINKLLRISQISFEQFTENNH